MKNLLIAAMALLSIAGCRALCFYGHYGYDFVGVTDNEFKDTVFTDKILTNDSLIGRSNVYEDSLISIIWKIENNNIRYELYNKTDENIEIDWRKVAFITPGGTMTRSAVNFNSFVPPHTTMVQNMQWQRFIPNSLYNLKRYNYTIWSTYKIIEIRPTYYIDVRDAWKEVLGRQFSIYFPMSIKGNEYNYRFVFEVSRLYVRQQKPDATYSVSKGEDFPKGYRTLDEIKKGGREYVRIIEQ